MVDEPSGGEAEDAPDADYDPAAATHRALRAIRRELERHPLVECARGFPPDVHSRVEAELHAERLDVDVDSATLRVRWFAGEEPGALPQFTFHYSDDGGTDCGWHHEPNPHVDDWGHFQHRTDGAEAYTYEPYAFATHVPARVVWEVLEQVRDAVGDR